MESLSAYFSNVFETATSAAELLKESVTLKLKSDADAGNPNKAWRKRLKKCECSSVKPMDPNMPVKKDHVRFVCISDTHTKLEQFRNLEIPAGDVLLHAGDFSMYGKADEVDVVNKYLGTLPHKHKVIIAGNHDITFDLDFIGKKRSTRVWTITEDNHESRLEHFGVKTVHEMLTDCIYLEDSMTEIYGIKIYGSPWTPGNSFWGFQRTRGPALMKKWNQIPTDVDILLTHCPPCGFGDNVSGLAAHKLKRLTGAFSDDHVGCVDLLNTVQKRVKPKYHVYGHIHEGYGVMTDGTTTFINASTCTETYDPKNPAIVFDFPLPQGYSKVQDDEILHNNVDICNNSDNFKTDCDIETELFETSEADSDLADSSNDKTSSNSNITADTADVEFCNEISGSSFLESVEEDDEADEEDVDSSNDIFFHCSTFSEGDSVSASNKDTAESDDDDSNIVFDSELDFETDCKGIGEKHQE